MAHSSSAMGRFNHLLGETTAAYHEVAVRLGLSDSVMDLLYTLYDCPGGRCALQELCRWTGISKQTVNSALRRLEAEGVLYLERAGGKRKTVCLTEAGRALAEGTVSKIMEAENAVFAAWSPEEVETYLTLTERYLLAFREEAKERIPEERSAHKPL